MKRTKKTIVASSVVAGSALAGALLLGGSALAADQGSFAAPAAGKQQVHRLGPADETKMREHFKCLQENGVKLPAKGKIKHRVDAAKSSEGTVVHRDDAAAKDGERMLVVNDEPVKIDSKTRQAFEKCGLPAPSEGRPGAHIAR